jgi:hypothetical protein
MDYNLREIFNQLLGTWVLSREITDKAGIGHLVGQCSFTSLSPTQILCNEQGILTYNGHQTEASRQYVYELRDDKIVILYHDAYRKGDILHELQFDKDQQSLVAKHCHVCGQDEYDLEFKILDPHKITMKYSVKGPHKDYSMVSYLNKIQPV